MKDNKVTILFVIRSKLPPTPPASKPLLKTVKAL
jgi:hypothetical protein